MHGGHSALQLPAPLETLCQHSHGGRTQFNHDGLKSGFCAVTQRCRSYESIAVHRRARLMVAGWKGTFLDPETEAANVRDRSRPREVCSWQRLSTTFRSVAPTAPRRALPNTPARFC